MRFGKNGFNKRAHLSSHSTTWNIFIFSLNSQKYFTQGKCASLAKMQFYLRTRWMYAVSFHISREYTQFQSAYSANRYIQSCLKMYLILYIQEKHTVPFRIFGERTQFLTALSGKVHSFIPGYVKAQNFILHIRWRCQKNPRQFFIKLTFRTTQGLQNRIPVLWGPQLLKGAVRKTQKKTFERTVYPNSLKRRKHVDLENRVPCKYDEMRRLLDKDGSIWRRYPTVKTTARYTLCAEVQYKDDIVAKYDAKTLSAKYKAMTTLCV